MTPLPTPILLARQRLRAPVVEPYGDQTRELSVLNLLRSEAGNYALRAADTTLDPDLRRLAKVREVAFDRIADAVALII
jgi:hypothetical protein